MSFTLVMDAITGGSKGFGFVEMEAEHEAVIAINELNGRKIGKSKIRVKQAAEKLAGEQL